MKSDMKTFYGIIVLLAMVLFVAACSTTTVEDTKTQTNDEQQTPSPTATPDEAETTVPTNTETSGKVPMTTIYNYASLSKFEYEVTSNVGGTSTKTNLKYAMSSDTVDSKAAWLMTTEVAAEGANVLQKQWVDKTTYGCINYVSSVSFNGQTFDTQGECPKQGPFAESKTTETPMVDYIGDESITVPLGTFSTKKYSLGDIVYYYAETVPIPVRVVYGKGMSVMDLVSWS